MCINDWCVYDLCLCVPTRDQYSKSKVSKGAKIKNQYNQAPHLTQDTNGKVTKSQLDTTNDSQGQPFPSRWPQGTYKQTHTNA